MIITTYDRLNTATPKKDQVFYYQSYSKKSELLMLIENQMEYGCFITKARIIKKNGRENTYNVSYTKKMKPIVTLEK